MDDEFDPRIQQMVIAHQQLELASGLFLDATVGMKGIINANTWKRVDKMLGNIQQLEYDIKEWMIRNGIE